MPFAATAAVFADSRALFGANRWYAEAAVELRALGPAAGDGAAQGRWLAQVVAAAQALGWPPPEPRVAPGPDGVRLAFRAPRGGLASARALNEWAWEQAAAAWAPQRPWAACPPAPGEFREQLRSLWAAERTPPLERLLDAADQRRLPWHLDADTLSIGEGRRAQLWPRAVLPWPADVPWHRLGSLPRVLLAGQGAETVARRLERVARQAGFNPAPVRADGEGTTAPPPAAEAVGGAEVRAVAHAAEHAAEHAAADAAEQAAAHITKAASTIASLARAALRDAATEALLMVQPPAELLHAGLAVPAAEVAVIGAPEASLAAGLGLADPEALAAVLLTLAHPLARSPSGRARLVLDGRSEPLLRAALQLPHAVSAEWAFYADDHDVALLQALRRQGGSTCGARAGRLVLWLDGVEHDLGPAGPDPADTAAAAAAGLAAACLGWPLDAVAAGLAAPDAGAEPPATSIRSAPLAAPAD
jgi:cyanophycin synthetase